MTIRCVTFDLDDTLWETGPVIARAEAAAYAWLERYAPQAVAGRTVDELSAQRRVFYSSLPHLSHDFTALRKAWLAHLLAEAGLEPARSEEAFMAFWRARNEITLFPGVIATLKRLRKRFVLGTITNGNACIEQIGLAQYFAFTVTAGDAGAMKPDPQIFDFALAKLGIKPEQTAHVGDNPRADMQGAMNHGMKAVWINPCDHSWDYQAHGAMPHGQVRHVGELEAALVALC